MVGLLIVTIFLLGLVIVCCLLFIELKTQKEINKKFQAKIYSQATCARSDSK